MNFSKRQIEIIEASKDLIGLKGIQNLTIRNLAEKMSFTQPSLYRHFKDKTAILKSVLLFYKDILSKGLITIVNSGQPSLVKIESIIKFQFNHFQENPAVIMVIFSETSFQYNSILSDVVAKIMKQKNKMLVGIIDEGKKKGEIRVDISSEQLATIIMGSMRLTVLKWKLTDFNSDLTNEGKVLWNTIEKLIKKQ
jgi:TetR/AcrR family transcriptional regulator, fatty acid metabolism regulator protein